MEMAGVRGVALSWFRSFLTGREQRVRVGHAVSAPLPVTTGVPQGSINSSDKTYVDATESSPADTIELLSGRR
ncbi:hypothetical protein J6590_059993 [Homalodisca vitripennis]|nr:hypothetical protein J6590_059993 [Homalodisca vitripennis]